MPSCLQQFPCSHAGRISSHMGARRTWAARACVLTFLTVLIAYANFASQVSRRAPWCQHANDHRYIYMCSAATVYLYIILPNLMALAARSHIQRAGPTGRVPGRPRLAREHQSAITLCRLGGDPSGKRTDESLTGAAE